MKYSAGSFGTAARVLVLWWRFLLPLFSRCFSRFSVRSFGIPFSGDTDGHVSGVVLIDEASGVFDIACW